MFGSVFLAGAANIQELVRLTGRALRDSGIESADYEARWMVSAATGLTNTQLVTAGHEAVDSRSLAKVSRFLDRRVAGEPLQYILGEASFRSWTFKVDPRVLIPRPETEGLVDLVLENLPAGGGSVIDIGTGSGCIAISVKLEAPETTVTAIDVSHDALEVARHNARLLGGDVHFQECDILEWSPESSLLFDIVVSNPPYIPDTEKAQIDGTVRDYEPHTALFAANNGMRFYNRIAGLAGEILKPSGTLLFEVHSPNAEAVVSSLSKRGFERIEVKTDLTGRSRYVICRTPHS